MNMEDEEEYVEFYDFSRIYRDHPLLIKEEEGKEVKDDEKGGEVKEGEGGKEGEGNDDGWEDCESLDSAEAD